MTGTKPAAIIAVFVAMCSLSAAAQEPATEIYVCRTGGVSTYTSKPIAGSPCKVAWRHQQTQITPFSSAPTILQACMDTGNGGGFASPSLRAQECTRQYCGRAEYVKKVSDYGLSVAQTEEDAWDALACLGRMEADKRR